MTTDSKNNDGYQDRFLKEIDYKNKGDTPGRQDFKYGNSGEAGGHIAVAPDENGDSQPVYVRDEQGQDITNQMGDQNDPE